MWTDADWDRLARTLKARRGAMGYATFRDFINDRPINYRTAWDAEHAVAGHRAKDRTNMRPETLDAMVDKAYGYVMGSGCRNILDGKDPELAPGTPGAPDPELTSADLSSFTPQQRRAIRGMVKLLADQEAAKGERTA
jgi:hypothetical protein